MTASGGEIGRDGNSGTADGGAGHERTSSGVDAEASGAFEDPNDDTIGTFAVGGIGGLRAARGDPVSMNKVELIAGDRGAGAASYGRGPAGDRGSWVASGGRGVVGCAGADGGPGADGAEL